MHEFPSFLIKSLPKCKARGQISANALISHIKDYLLLQLNSQRSENNTETSVFEPFDFLIVLWIFYRFLRFLKQNRCQLIYHFLKLRNQPDNLAWGFPNPTRGMRSHAPPRTPAPEVLCWPRSLFFCRFVGLRIKGKGNRYLRVPRPAPTAATGPGPRASRESKSDTTGDAACHGGAERGC